MPIVDDTQPNEANNARNISNLDMFNISFFTLTVEPMGASHYVAKRPARAAGRIGRFVSGHTC